MCILQGRVVPEWTLVSRQRTHHTQLDDEMISRVCEASDLESQKDLFQINLINLNVIMQILFLNTRGVLSLMELPH